MTVSEMCRVAALKRRWNSFNFSGVTGATDVNVTMTFLIVYKLTARVRALSNIGAQCGLSSGEPVPVQR